MSRTADGDPEVAALLADHPTHVTAVAERVRAAVLGARPELVEAVRRGWHSINYHDRAAGFVCAIFPTADRVQLVFERGADLPDAEGLLRGSGKRVRMLVFTSVDEVDEDVVAHYVELAVAVGAALRR